MVAWFHECLVEILIFKSVECLVEARLSMIFFVCFSFILFSTFEFTLKNSRLCRHYLFVNVYDS